ncbi:hypothetical protein KSX49_20740, partial [Phocaeicola dorei]
RICRPLLKVSSTDIRTGSAPGTLPGFRWWTRGNTIHLNFHYFFAGILVPFVKNVIWNIVP